MSNQLLNFEVIKQTICLQQQFLIQILKMYFQKLW